MWKEIGLDMDKIMDGCLEFLDLLWYARIVKQGYDGWGIWTNRNEVRHGKSRKPASVLDLWTKEYLENYVMANHSLRPYKEFVEAT